MSETSTSTKGSPDFEMAQQGLFDRVMPKVWRMASILPIPAQAGFSPPNKIFPGFPPVGRGEKLLASGWRATSHWIRSPAPWYTAKKGGARSLLAKSLLASPRA